MLDSLGKPNVTGHGSLRGVMEERQFGSLSRSMDACITLGINGVKLRFGRPLDLSFGVCRF